MKWFETLIFILAVISVLYLLLRLRLQDQAFLKKKTKETMAPELRKKIEEESEENRRKKEKFENIMKNFGVKD